MKTLADIRQMAMDKIDEQSVRASGKFSKLWWNRQINEAKDVLAQETGYFRRKFELPVTGNNPTVLLPNDFCYGVFEVAWDGVELDSADMFEMEESEASDPTEYVCDGQQLKLNPPPTRTVLPGTSILTATAGAGFTNQPQNDAVELVSSDTSDTTATVDIYGTTFRTNTVVKETVTLNGTTVVTTTKTDWGYILGVELSAACTGTITVREASANATITTIAPAATTAGISLITTTCETGKAKPRVYANTTSQSIIALVGTDVSGNALSDCCVALPGAKSDAQPQNGAVELWATTGDTRTVSVIGTTFGTNNVVTETGIALTSTSTTVPVTTTKTDWGEIISIVPSAAHATYIVTARTASDITIDTIPATETLVQVPLQSFSYFPKRMQTVTHVLLGAIPATTNVTVEVGGALEVTGGGKPIDMNADSDIVIALPDQFANVLAIGAAALSQVSDLYGQPQEGRASIYLKDFWNGVERVKTYIGSLGRDNIAPMQMDTSLYGEHFHQ